MTDTMKMRGDFHALGCFPDPKYPYNIDVDKLLAYERTMKTNAYHHYVSDHLEMWIDFLRLLPRFQKAGIDVWLALSSPRWPPKPYGLDYITFARELATLSITFKCIRGMWIDDWCWYTGTAHPLRTLSVPYTQEIKKELDAQSLKLLGLCYYSEHSDYPMRNVLPHAREGLFDGMIVPHQRFGASEQMALNALAEAAGAIEYWDPLQIYSMIYCSKHSQWPGAATREQLSAQIRALMELDELAGIITYMLPKNSYLWRHTPWYVYGWADWLAYLKRRAAAKDGAGGAS